jgi:hypothetical protein
MGGGIEGDDRELGAKLSTIGIEPLQLAERKRSVARAKGGEIVLLLEVSFAFTVVILDK